MANIKLGGTTAISESSGTVSVKTDNYQKADGTAMITSGVAQAGFALGVNAVDQRRGSHVYIASSVNNSAVSEVDFHNCFTTTYTSYYLEGRFMPVTSGASMKMQISDGGASFSEAGTNDHAGGRVQLYSDNSTHAYNSNGIDTSSLNLGYSQNNNPTYDIHGHSPVMLKMWLWDCNTIIRRTCFQYELSSRHSTTGEGNVFLLGYGVIKKLNSDTGIRLYYDTGNIAQHGVDIFGIVNGSDLTEP